MPSPPIYIESGPYRGFYLSPPDRRPDPIRVKAALDSAREYRENTARWILEFVNPKYEEKENA